MHRVFKASELALWKKYTVFIKSCCNLITSLFLLLIATAESVSCSLFLKNLEKTALQFDLQKNFVKHIENLPQH